MTRSLVLLVPFALAITAIAAPIVVRHVAARRRDRRIAQEFLAQRIAQRLADVPRR